MTIHQINGISIRTSFVYPPIPLRCFDYSAVNDDTYDCDCPIGYGVTEQDAIKDLIEQMEEASC